jgi:hypothetical protein
MTSAAELEARGRAAHACGDYAGAVDAYERAFVAYRDAGDRSAAARAARTVGWFRGWVFGEWAVCRGWMSRSRALLEATADASARGWVVLDDAQQGNDLDTHWRRYDEVIEIARDVGDTDLECEALASLGIKP